MSDILFSHGNVEITKAVARFGKTSYPIKNIGAITIEEKTTRYRWVGVLVILLSPIAFIFFPVWVAVSQFAIGVVLLFLKPTTEFGLVLATSSGNQQAYSSSNEESFKRIQRALEMALSEKA